MKETRLIIVDDHKLVHHSIGQSLGMEPGLAVVARANTGKSAVKLAAAHKPDIMLMDISMPDMNGMEACRQILAENPGVKILALTMHSEKVYIMGMLNAGASGYLLKSCAYTELLTAIETVLSGKVYLSRDIAHLLTDQTVNQENQTTDRFSQLSPRERDVLKLIADGHTSKEIAARQNISPRTVDIHRNNLKKKLGVHSIAGLTKIAISKGLTSVPVSFSHKRAAQNTDE
jgi:two-component system, NarL family, response regulator NreC